MGLANPNQNTTGRIFLSTVFIRIIATKFARMSALWKNIPHLEPHVHPETARNIKIQTLFVVWVQIPHGILVCFEVLKHLAKRIWKWSTEMAFFEYYEYIFSTDIPGILGGLNLAHAWSHRLFEAWLVRGWFEVNLLGDVTIFASS